MARSVASKSTGSFYIHPFRSSCNGPVSLAREKNHVPPLGSTGARARPLCDDAKERGGANAIREAPRDQCGETEKEFSESHQSGNSLRIRRRNRRLHWNE